MNTRLKETFSTFFYIFKIIYIYLSKIVHKQLSTNHV